MRLITLALPILVVSTSGFAAPFTYKLDRWSPKLEVCQASREEVKTRFESLTGRQVIQISCDGSIPSIFSLVLTYDGQLPLVLISSADEFAMSQGSYASLAHCQAGLAAEAETFQIQTGLEPVIKYCYSESSSSDVDQPFVPRIDAFGTPVLRPIVLERSIYRAPKRPLTAIAEDIRVAAEAEGLEALKVTVDKSSTFHRILMRYYAKRRLPVGVETVLTFKNDEACESSRQQVADLLAAVDVSTMTSFCASDIWSQYTELYTVSYTKGAHSVESAPGRYTEESECESDRQSVVDGYRSLGRDVVGSMCGYIKGSILEADGFFVRLFMRL